jgi:hypothetical protein
MAEWLHVGVRNAGVTLGGSNFAIANSNEALRLQPPVPSGSQRTVGKGKGTKVLGKL